MIKQEGIKKIVIICALFIFIFNAADAQRRRPITLNTGSGYVTINEMTGGYGLAGTSSDYADYFYGFTTTHGYQWNMRGLGVNQSMSGAMGAGILIYESGKLFPLFGDLRFTINRAKVSPYFMARGGMLISSENFDKLTQLFINAGAGVNIKIIGNLAVNLGPGLLVQAGGGARESFVTMNAGIWFKP
jgi:ribulose 1,5-bisphosphate carboxylase large subunit-like protein